MRQGIGCEANRKRKIVWHYGTDRREGGRYDKLSRYNHPKESQQERVHQATKSHVHSTHQTADLRRILYIHNRASQAPVMPPREG
jgi:hypothetical protein